MNETIKILGIYGSLRKNSYNHALLKEAAKVLPENTTLEIFEGLREIPPFDQDHENELPPAVADLKNKILESDAILFATPEYNFSIPGILKNAIDWASHPYGHSAWTGKPAAIMGASISMAGTARAQLHLRQIFAELNVFALNKPEMMVANASDKFDENGNITDQHTKDKVKQMVQALRDWAIRLKKS